MRLATDAGGLVPAERRMRGIGVEAIGPDAAGLDRTAHAIRRITVARPDASAEAVERVICNRERIRLVLELRDRNDRPEDLFLEDLASCCCGQDRRLDVVAAGQLFACRQVRQQDNSVLRALCQHPSLD